MNTVTTDNRSATTQSMGGNNRQKYLMFVAFEPSMIDEANVFHVRAGYKRLLL